MRSFQNDGSEQYILQNEFTAYLQTAIRRAKVRYLNKKNRVTDTEIPNDSMQMSSISHTAGSAAFSSLSNFVDILEADERLELGILVAEMLAQLSERELMILKGKIFDGLTFPELAEPMEIDVNTVKSIYYRSLKKLRTYLDI